MLQIGGMALELTADLEPITEEHGPQLGDELLSGIAGLAKGSAEISWKGLRCNLEVSGVAAGLMADLRREKAGGPSVATTTKPLDDGGARLLVEDDDLVGAAVVAVLLSPDGRLIAQRRTVVGGEA